ncbi:MAG: acetylglutamate kinase [Bacteroidetes bacterium]|nr:acetylglutamate kinase [Bacteroidota bacterium]
MKPVLKIVKIGGNVIDDEAALHTFLEGFAALAPPKILVHGGGKIATQLATRLGVETKMTGGRRITDQASLDVVVMTYAGLLNKKVVALLQKNGCNAIGLSGADAGSILSRKRNHPEIDFGFVGDVQAVHSENIDKLLQAGFTPVFCAITHDREGHLLNTNADTIASELAIAMSAIYQTELIYCFEKKGVLRDVNDANSVIEHIDSQKYIELKNDQIIADGMLPKMENCFHALQNNVSKVIIGNPSLIGGKETLFTTLTL